VWELVVGPAKAPEGFAAYMHFAGRIGAWFDYPKGIVSSSPGLAPGAYPGKVVGGFSNPNGVVTRPPLATGMAATPLGFGIMYFPNAEIWLL
jgi:hypothetical protein